MKSKKNKKFTSLSEVLEAYTPKYIRAVEKHNSNNNSFDFTRKGMVTAHQLAQEFEKRLTSR